MFTLYLINDDVSHYRIMVCLGQKIKCIVNLKKETFLQTIFNSQIFQILVEITHREVAIFL